jgi:hypothetical protein
MLSTPSDKLTDSRGKLGFAKSSFLFVSGSGTLRALVSQMIHDVPWGLFYVSRDGRLDTRAHVCRGCGIRTDAADYNVAAELDAGVLNRRRIEAGS